MLAWWCEVKTPTEIFQVVITWCPSHLSNQVSSPHAARHPLHHPLSARRPQGLQGGGLSIWATPEALQLVWTPGRELTLSLLFLSQTWVLYASQVPYLSRPAGLSFLNFKRFIRILIETKNAFGEEPKKSTLHITLPYLGRGWEDFPPCSEGLWSGVRAPDPGCLGLTSALPPLSCGTPLRLSNTELQLYWRHPYRIQWINIRETWEHICHRQGSRSISFYHLHGISFLSDLRKPLLRYFICFAAQRGFIAWLPFTEPSYGPAPGLSALHSLLCDPIWQWGDRWDHRASGNVCLWQYHSSPIVPTAVAPSPRIPIMCLLVECCTDHCNLPVGSKAISHSREEHAFFFGFSPMIFFPCYQVGSSPGSTSYCLWDRGHVIEYL